MSNQPPKNHKRKNINTGPESRMPSYLNFDLEGYKWKPDIDYHQHPELYSVGNGEQGVLICEPYKSEIGKFWRFKNADIAKESAEKIYGLFLSYLEQNDFVGADMSRKYLQMGYTRARRYANYKGGKKYDKEDDYKNLKRGTGEDEKAVSASIFYKYWQLAENNEYYKSQKKAWKTEKG